MGLKGDQHLGGKKWRGEEKKKPSSTNAENAAGSRSGPEEFSMGILRSSARSVARHGGTPHAGGRNAAK